MAVAFLKASEQGRLYQVRGPSHKGLCGAPQTTIFLFYDVPTFLACLRMCGPQSKGGVLFNKYLASIQHFNTLESLTLFFFIIE